MKIPRITMSFESLICETEKAYQFIINNKPVWMPKSLISDIRVIGGYKLNGASGRGTFNVAPFKYQEMTGIIPQSIDSLVIDEIASNLEYNTIENYDIIEPKGINLRDSQINKISRIKRLSKFFVYGQMRTGKTVIATTIAESRLKAGLISNIVVISPLRTFKVWKNHLSVYFDFIPTEHFSNENTRNNLNFHCDENTMVILDESHQIKNRTALRTDLIISLTKDAGHKCILTGTPIGKHAGDLFNQFYFLDPGILNYNSYSDFEAQHLLYGGREGKQVVAYTNIEEISKRISPYTVIMSRKEMGIDREKKYQLVTYEPKNYDTYKDFEKRNSELIDLGKSTTILGSLVKLQQCANGYIFDEDNNCIGIEDNGRTECLENILKSLEGESIVIYFKYNDDLKLLNKVGIPILSGKTNQKTFNETIDKFNSKEIKVIALQQQISIGFSLKACDYMIYFSRKFGSIGSAQSEDRACESIDKPLTIIDIVASNTIDFTIKSTINKQFEIINLFKNSVK